MPGAPSATSSSVFRNRVARFLAQQDPHSLYVAAAGTLFACTLVIDLLLHRDDLLAWVLWLLLAFCLALSATALAMGRRFPVGAGLGCVVVFTAASIYFLSPAGDESSAVASAQELPILALYLGWFVPRPLGRVLMFAITALLVVAIAINPLFWATGVFGVPTAVQTIVIALLCFQIGSMLWRQSERRITTDQLTGALNRSAFCERLDHDLARASRTGSPLSLVVIDFDGFKELNDTRGHVAGDFVLSDTVLRWRSVVRADDAIGRTGGDEFALILERSDAEYAERVVRRLLEASQQAWSWGLAQFEPGDDRESLFKRADEALYAMKRGRTR